VRQIDPPLPPPPTPPPHVAALPADDESVGGAGTQRLSLSVTSSASGCSRRGAIVTATVGYAASTGAAADALAFALEYDAAAFELLSAERAAALGGGRRDFSAAGGFGAALGGPTLAKNGACHLDEFGASLNRSAAVPPAAGRPVGELLQRPSSSKRYVRLSCASFVGAAAVPGAVPAALTVQLRARAAAAAGSHTFPALPATTVLRVRGSASVAGTALSYRASRAATLLLSDSAACGGAGGLGGVDGLGTRVHTTAPDVTSLALAGLRPATLYAVNVSAANRVGRSAPPLARRGANASGAAAPLWHVADLTVLTLAADAPTVAHLANRTRPGDGVGTWGGATRAALPFGAAGPGWCGGSRGGFACHGHGTCQSDGSCRCTSGWSGHGAECEFQECVTFGESTAASEGFGPGSAAGAALRTPSLCAGHGACLDANSGGAQWFDSPLTPNCVCAEGCGARSARGTRAAAWTRRRAWRRAARRARRARSARAFAPSRWRRRARRAPARRRARWGPSAATARRTAAASSSPRARPGTWAPRAPPAASPTPSWAATSRAPPPAPPRCCTAGCTRRRSASATSPRSSPRRAPATGSSVRCPAAAARRCRRRSTTPRSGSTTSTTTRTARTSGPPAP